MPVRQSRFRSRPSMSIVVRTLSEQVFEIVREQIVTGKLAIG